MPTSVSVSFRVHRIKQSKAICKAKMDEQKQKLIERIKQAQNVLITVSANPSVDQLAAAIGLTLALNKQDKHATAVFSGQVPSTIEFLKPEDTLEKDTNSLRDFIIALDKSKADKLRYKVEDQVVRIFITPYRTSISEKDLNFSQGDFNVDVVIALGVTEQQDLDTAITAHGRILHDAAVASVMTAGQSNLGSINWADPSASSLSEMVTDLVDTLDKQIVDNQIATALLTGIVASTERFSNEKTTPRTMSVSAELMAAGANQQLIATQLEALAPASPTAQPTTVPVLDTPTDEPAVAAPAKEPGTLEIEHQEAPEAPEPDSGQPKISVDADGELHFEAEAEETPPPAISNVAVAKDTSAPDATDANGGRSLLVEPPRLGDAPITANSTPEGLEPSAEELTLPPVDAPLLKHNETVLSPLPEPSVALSLPPVPPVEPFTPPAPAAPAAPTPVFQPAPPSWKPPESTLQPTPPAPVMPPAPAPLPPPTPPMAPAVDSIPPMPPLLVVEPVPDVAPFQPAPVVAEPAPAEPAPAPVAPEPPIALDDARDAVQAAFNSADAPALPAQPLASLNALPLGPDLRQPQASAAPDMPAMPAAAVPMAPAPVNPGIAEPLPGNTPADHALDMPLPSNPFGPGMQMGPAAPSPAPPSAFPGAPAPGSAGPLPPPVPPPMVPPVQ